MDITLRFEEEADFRTVENLTREAFWNVYKPGCDEHLVLHNLRSSQDFIPELDFVAELDGAVVGNIVYSKGKIVNENGMEHEVICFGPISVLPACQNKGIGRRLIEHSAEVAKAKGFKAIVIFGNPAYYQRFGFEDAEKFDIHTSDGKNFAAFMVKELLEGSLQGISGRFIDSEAFKVNNEELEMFEKAFPPKEKKVTDTQLKEQDYE
ncbi:MAG: GNAT family N-acetyltransferase [Anaerolineaceae bacterium]